MRGLVAPVCLTACGVVPARSSTSYRLAELTWDVVSVDRLEPGVLRRSGEASDAGVTGGVAPGDLPVTSPTPGHARRAPEHPAPGTGLGKAIDALEVGQGTIGVVLSSR